MSAQKLLRFGKERGTHSLLKMWRLEYKTFSQMGSGQGHMVKCSLLPLVKSKCIPISINAVFCYFHFFPSYITLQIQNILISLKCLLLKNTCCYQTTILNSHPLSAIGAKGFFFSPVMLFFWILILLCQFYIISDFNQHDFVMAMTELLKRWIWGQSPEACPWRPPCSGQVVTQAGKSPTNENVLQPVFLYFW